MALTQCPECKQQISTSAPACPHCGAVGPFAPMLPLTKEQAKKAAGHLPGSVVLMAFVVLAAVIWWMAGGSSGGSGDAATTPGPVKVETQADKDRDAGMGAVAIARETVKTMLKDADSAKFSNQFAVKTDKGDIVACGEVNARNGFGGYTGNSVYVMQDDTVRVENGDNANDVRRRWNATCAKFPAVYTRAQL